MLCAGEEGQGINKVRSHWLRVKHKFIHTSTFGSNGSKKKCPSPVVFCLNSSDNNGNQGNLKIGFQGDSGGPITVEEGGVHILAGIASFGPIKIPVAPSRKKAFPDVFTRVSHFLPWINTTILSNGGLDSCNFSLIAPPNQGSTIYIIGEDGNRQEIL